MPEPYIRFGQKWKELNPGWTVIDWTEEVISEFFQLKHVFDHMYERDAGRGSIELYVQLADVVGYALVERYGGVYMNCDMEPVRPLPRLPEMAWASYENNEDGRIVNAAIGSPQANDPFWKALLEGLPRRYFADPTAEMVETTGPAYLTDFANWNKGKLYVFPTETFNPIHWKQIPEGGDASGREYSSKTIAVHHWGHKKDKRTNRIEGATR
jgi:mannosyltransferase OCH1-like enzyme